MIPKIGITITMDCGVFSEVNGEDGFSLCPSCLGKKEMALHLLEKAKVNGHNSFALYIISILEGK